MVSPSTLPLYLVGSVVLYVLPGWVFFGIPGVMVGLISTIIVFVVLAVLSADPT